MPPVVGRGPLSDPLPQLPDTRCGGPREQSGFVPITFGCNGIGRFRDIVAGEFGAYGHRHAPFSEEPERFNRVLADFL